MNNLDKRDLGMIHDILSGVKVGSRQPFLPYLSREQAKAELEKLVVKTYQLANDRL